MVGTAGFVALCLLAATPNASTAKTSHTSPVLLAKLQSVKDNPGPFNEDKPNGDKADGGKTGGDKVNGPQTNGDKADGTSGDMSRLPKTLPNDPGYETGKQTAKPQPNGAAEKKSPPTETAPPVEEKQTPPIAENRVEENVSVYVPLDQEDPCNETCCPRTRCGRLGWFNGVSSDCWLDQGVTLNTLSPRNRSNGPVTFNDRSNEYQLNQFYLRMKRGVDAEGDAWDVGGNVDLLYGTDSIFVTSRGLEVRDDLSPRWNSQRYGLAMPQLYGEVYSPWGDGLSMKLGHFYSPMGYESAPATGNFFYSHSYAYQYGEPKTFTGLLGETSLGQFTFQAGLTRGWNNWEDDNNDLGFLGGIYWKSKSERTKMSFCISTGREEADPHSNARTIYSLVLEEQLNENWQYVVQHDYGKEPEAGTDRTVAAWYGINQYLFYTINESWKAGMRFEWFTDLHGARVPSDSHTTNYFEMTSGLNWTPSERIMVRPELRWDWSATPGATPFGDGTRSNQFLLDCDVVMRF
jgi:hypothetical protein